jgi:adenosylcobinamide-phosphate synthase
VSFIALAVALVLCFYRPSPDWLRRLLQPYTDLLDRNFNDNRPQHGVIAWLLAVVLPVVIVAVVYIALYHIYPLLSMLFAIGILYLLLRLDQLVAAPEQIAAALRDHNINAARAHLVEWQQCDAQSYGAREVARVSIEATLRQAHYDLFAPILWFVLLGPAAALLYRLAYWVQSAWAGRGRFGEFASTAFGWLDWLPARFTASSFAIVGDFEDAIYCWRTQAAAWPNKTLGILLASGAGALGVRLGEPLSSKGVVEFRPELGVGDEADADYLQSATGLVWRVLVLMALLLLLLTFAHWLGN